MIHIAIKMLMGDRAKYIGLIFGIAFATFLMSQQVSIFVGVLARTASQIWDINSANIWVMDPGVRYVDEIIAMPDIKLSKVRSVAGIEWAVPFYKGLAVVKTGKTTQQIILLGLDNDSYVGAPHKMVAGSLQDLKRPNTMIIDKAGWEFIWGKEPYKLGRTIEINDNRVEIVGICEASPPFMTFPVVYVKYSEALKLIPQSRNRMSFILARTQKNESPATVAKSIQKKTGLQALTMDEFAWRSIDHYLKKTGIPINFGLTVTLGFIIGAVIAGQTFYIFVIENLRQFGALKAIGLNNMRILKMITFQASLVGFIGYSVGIGLTTLFFKATANVTALRGFGLPWQVALAVACAVCLIMIVSSLISVRKLFTLDPAIVFRG